MDDSRRRAQQRRWRWRWALLALGGALLLAGWLKLGATPAANAGPPIAAVRSASSQSPRAFLPLRAVASTAEPSGPALPPPAAPIIDAVTVEKPEVCSGEENLISIRAHTPDGTDAHLHYSVGESSGARVPYRVWLTPDGEAVLPSVTVFGKHNVATRVPVPRYTVKACEPSRIVVLRARLLPNTPDEYELSARLLERPAREGVAPARFVPARWVWMFDDRETETTAAPRTTHVFTGVQRKAQYLQHLVQVDAFDARGAKVTGRVALEVLSTTFENFDQRGVVTLLAAGTPRFPELGDDGVVRQTFRLHHHWEGPVRLSRVTVSRAFTPPADAPPLPEQVEELELPVSVIPEGEGARVQVTLDTRAEPTVTSLTYTLEGRSADGHPARGTFSVMRPPPPPTREASHPVMDPALKARILWARETLGRPYVTDEDLWRLEREGRLPDVPTAPAPAP